MTIRIYKPLILLLAVSVVVCVKIVTFGDSTLENNKCSSDLLGVPFPPTPPYSEFIRYSGNWSWVDYLEQELNEVEIISCACGHALATQDFPFDPFDSGSPAIIPGLLTQIENCNEDNDLDNIDDNLTAIIQIGGQDLREPVISQSIPHVTPEQFSESFKFAIQNLTELGFDQIYIGNTILREIEYPVTVFLRAVLPEDIINLTTQIQTSLLDAFDAVLIDMKSEGYPVNKIPIGEIIVDIQGIAQMQGFEAFQPCLNPLTGWHNLEVLPTCTDLNNRVWMDGVHLADWAQQQYGKRMADILDV